MSETEYKKEDGTPLPIPFESIDGECFRVTPVLRFGVCNQIAREADR